MKKVVVVLVLIALSFVFNSNGIIAEVNGELSVKEILQKVDEVQAPDDRSSQIEMILIDKNNIKLVRKVTLKQKGDKRLLKFLAPPDVKGVGFLSLSENEMWLYMPVLKKVRRIASHIKNSSFMGTDFSYDDIGGSKFSENYKSKLIKQNDNSYIIELIPISKDKKYSKLLMSATKKTFIPEKVEYFDKKGRPLKTLTSTEIEKINNRWAAKNIKMVNHQTKHSTEMIFSKNTFDSGISDTVFTVRYLER